MIDTFVKNNIQLRKTLPANKIGRDFTIGDIHGDYNGVFRLLDKVKFTEDDRLFSTGDLTDRGPDSIACLSLVMEKWFFPVISNHDVELIYFTNGLISANHFYEDNYRLFLLPFLEEFLYNKHGQRYSTQASELWEAYIPALQQCPFIYTIEDEFHILHAELKPTYTNKDMMADDSVLNDRYMHLNTYNTIMPMYSGLYSRTIWKNHKHNPDMLKQYANLFHHSDVIYSGHTPVDNCAPLRVGQLVNIDTGGYFGDATHGLSIVEHSTQRAWIYSNSIVKEVSIASL